jgi:hypothetical protein
MNQTAVQIGLGILAVLVFMYWDKLKNLLTSFTTKTSKVSVGDNPPLDHLQNDCSAIVDIAVHLYAHGKGDEAKTQLEVIGTLVEIYVEESDVVIVPPVVPVTPGGPVNA